MHIYVYIYIYIYIYILIFIYIKYVTYLMIANVTDIFRTRTAQIANS